MMVKFLFIPLGIFRRQSMFRKVIAGLSNLGVCYENTRHNMGFAVIDYFIETL
jgi:hypothetical protein